LDGHLLLLALDLLLGEPQPLLLLPHLLRQPLLLLLHSLTVEPLLGPELLLFHSVTPRVVNNTRNMQHATRNTQHATHNTQAGVGYSSCSRRSFSCWASSSCSCLRFSCRASSRLFCSRANCSCLSCSWRSKSCRF